MPIIIPPIPDRLDWASTCMRITPDGKYVKYEDYNTVRFQNTTLLSDNTQMFAALKKVKEENTAKARLYDLLHARTTEITQAVRDYLALPSNDNFDAARLGLRHKLQSLVADSELPLELGCTVYIEKNVGTSNAYAEVRQLDDVFVWVSNDHWPACSGTLSYTKMFKTEVRVTTL